MARPRTKGNLIQFRLPIEVDAALVERCAEKGETPSDFVARYIERAVRQQIMKED